MSKIDKVINDIERRRREYIEICEKYPEQSVCEVDAVLGELDEILAFINSLPDEPASEDLDKAADEYEEERLSDYGYRGEWSGAFIAGAEWQKEQMLKEAVEGWIIDSGFDDGTAFVTMNIPDRRYDRGDKVRIIVLKAEEE